jgi:hypothetical protein
MRIYYKTCKVTGFLRAELNTPQIKSELLLLIIRKISVIYSNNASVISCNANGDQTGSYQRSRQYDEISLEQGSWEGTPHAANNRNKVVRRNSHKTI